MKHFKQVTTTPPAPGLVNAVIMGRKTWESIPERFRPLTGRTNVVLSRNPDYKCNDALVVSSLPEALQLLDDDDKLGEVFVIGGAQVYEQALALSHDGSPVVTKVIYTQVSQQQQQSDDIKENTSNTTPTTAAPQKTTFQFDAFFPDLPETDWTRQPYHATPRAGSDAGGLDYSFWLYTRRSNNNNNKTPDELQYLQLCRDILAHGVRRDDRTGTGTLSQFGPPSMKFDLRGGTLPLLTTKRTFWRGVAEELLWFVSGSTNASDLARKDIHIWDGNGSQEFLQQRGLGHREEGDLGPVYGFQWRHFGAKYVDMHTDYTGQGVDQLAACIDKIKHHPEDRRIVLSAWNPADLDLMALPPCHMFCQFYVSRVKLYCGERDFVISHRVFTSPFKRWTRRRMSFPVKCTSAVLTWVWAFPLTLPRTPYSPTWWLM